MIKLFVDQETTKVVESLDLGRVELCKSIKYKMYIKNTDEQWAVHNIKLENTNPELKFDFPEILKPNEVREMFVYWTPKLDSRKPLNAEFKFTGEVYIG